MIPSPALQTRIQGRTALVGGGLAALILADAVSREQSTTEAHMANNIEIFSGILLKTMETVANDIRSLSKTVNDIDKRLEVVTHETRENCKEYEDALDSIKKNVRELKTTSERIEREYETLNNDCRNLWEQVRIIKTDYKGIQEDIIPSRFVRLSIGDICTRFRWIIGLGIVGSVVYFGWCIYQKVKGVLLP